MARKPQTQPIAPSAIDQAAWGENILLRMDMLSQMMSQLLDLTRDIHHVHMLHLQAAQQPAEPPPPPTPQPAKSVAESLRNRIKQ